MTTLCLRQGYHCTCEQCKIWIARWAKELESFEVVDKLIHEGSSLFQIYERLRAEYPDTLRLYHTTIENQYFDFKRAKEEPTTTHTRKKRIRVKNKTGSSCSSSASSLSTSTPPDCLAATLLVASPLQRPLLDT